MNRLSFRLVLLAALLCLLVGFPRTAQALELANKVFLPFVQKPVSAVNHPPEVPNTPGPAAGVSNQPLGLTLSWKGGDPDSDEVRYTIYLNASNSNPSTAVATNISALSYSVTGLSLGTTYYWKVVASDVRGLSTAGPVWSFTTSATPPTPATHLDLHYYNGCAITKTAGLKCWGSSITNLTGDPLDPDANKAVVIPGLSDVKSISVNSDYACVLSNAGGVKCWGQNWAGQLGRGDTTNSLTADYVDGLDSGVKAISTGDLFACALTNAGGVKCWGNNSRGQLGSGEFPRSLYPIDVYGLSNGVTAITSGERHTCALKNGGVWCWGSNEFGQIGRIDGILVDDYLVPVQPDGLTSGVIGISVGANTSCAVLTGGAVKCWGLNSVGQTGNGDNLPVFSPEDVVGLSGGVKSVSVGLQTSCAVMNDVTLKCWGNNMYGQVGNGSTTGDGVLSPVTVSGVTGVLEANSGSGHTCALLSGGGIKCWGYNYYGQLGNGTFNSSLTPVTVLDK